MSVPKTSIQISKHCLAICQHWNGLFTSSGHDKERDFSISHLLSKVKKETNVLTLECCNDFWNINKYNWLCR